MREAEPERQLEIQVAANVIKINPDKARNYPLLPVLRTGPRKLYDKYNQTYTFSQDIYADLSYLLDWSDLPQPAREYITSRAGRIYNDRALNDQELRQSLLLNEQIAMNQLNQWDAEEADENIFSDPQFAQMITRHSALPYSW